MAKPGAWMANGKRQRHTDINASSNFGFSSRRSGFSTQTLDKQIPTRGPQLKLRILISPIGIRNSNFGFSTRRCGFSPQSWDS